MFHQSIFFVTMMATVGGTSVASGIPHSRNDIVELRQYKLERGKRDEFISLFENHFIESQEELGMRLAGQFRDMDDPNRFTWIRTFPNMISREASLKAFYFGQVWQKHRDTANPMLIDNDNVLLLKPAWPDGGFEILERKPHGAACKEQPLFATVHYLWKDPAEGFSNYFKTVVEPKMHEVGLPLLGAYVTEHGENTFPRLPVRQAEKVFVVFTQATDPERYSAQWNRLLSAIGAQLADYEERSPQLLRLQPTDRSTIC